MKFLSKCKDGGPESPVTAYVLVEIKSLFSVMLLHFSGTREAFHSHAFNALTLWLSGSAIERFPRGRTRLWKAGEFKYTPRECFHRVEPQPGTWALSIRGPWAAMWQEVKGKTLTTLGHGRKIVVQEQL
jgi:hypothetical protein